MATYTRPQFNTGEGIDPNVIYGQLGLGASPQDYGRPLNTVQTKTPGPDQDPTGQNPDPGGANTGAPGGSDPSTGGGSHGALTAADLYDRLLAAWNKSGTAQSEIKALAGDQVGTDWITRYKDALINNIIPNAMTQYGTAGIVNTLNENWRKAIYAAFSAASVWDPDLQDYTYYDRTGSGEYGLPFGIQGYTVPGAGKQKYGYSGLWT